MCCKQIFSTVRDIIADQGLEWNPGLSYLAEHSLLFYGIIGLYKLCWWEQTMKWKEHVIGVSKGVIPSKIVSIHMRLRVLTRHFELLLFYPIFFAKKRDDSCKVNLYSSHLFCYCALDNSLQNHHPISCCNWWISFINQNTIKFISILTWVFT